MRAALTLLPLALLALPAEAGRKKGQGAAPPVTTSGLAVPPTGLSLRSAFDTDPSVYLGRFVPDDLTGPVDESSAMPTACSRFVTARSVDAGGVLYDEVFAASTEAAARAGVPAVLGAGLDASFSATVRVRYALTRKLVAEIADPEGFAACCAEASGQCTGRFVGEFLEGTGMVYYAARRAAGADLDVLAQGAAGGLEVDRGVAWQRSVEFSRPVYFAMKTTRNAYTPAVTAPLEGGCGPWVDAPPRSAQGQYYVGVSDLSDSERSAREAALLDARVQVVRWLGESITTGTLRVQTVSGTGARLTTALQQQTTLQAAASGVATFVKDQAWCVQATPTPAGYRYLARVLAFLPDGAAAPAAEAMIRTAP